MSSNYNPAKISKNSRYKQGYYQCTNPHKYIGDPKKIIYRSSWELKICQKLDHADYVLGWACEAPHPLIYISPKDGLPHRYYPDFIVVTFDKINNKKVVTLIEVKPYKEKFPPSKKGKKKSRYIQECVTYSINQAKWEAARKFCEQKGWQFSIMTEKEILGK
jgi:hypothetical protein